MYLTRKHYVKNWEHTEPEKRFEITVKRGGVDYAGIDISKIVYIDEWGAQWRKAQAIHDWFVREIQHGEDDCKEYYVELDELERLVNTCKQVLESVTTSTPLPKTGDNYIEWAEIKVSNEGLSSTLLPTYDSQYDGYYLQELQQTIDQLEPFLNYDKEGNLVYDEADFYYSSSW